MSKQFPVRLNAPKLPVAGDRPVVFHGVNKSGSLAMENVIREAYHHSGRGHQCFSHYAGNPKHFEEIAPLLWQEEGHRFFCAHYLYGGIEMPSDTVLIGQVRHPLPRTLSVYGWLRRNYEARHGSLDGMPDLERWVRSSQGRLHTVMSQFAVGFPPNYKKRLRAMSRGAVYDAAIVNLERDFAWFGVAEYFEESIFGFAHICGLESVSPWRKDTRNKWRQPLAEIGSDTIALIEEVFAHEIRFYEYAVALFHSRVEDIDFGDSLSDYKQRCAGEYGERQLLPSRIVQ